MPRQGEGRPAPTTVRHSAAVALLESGVHIKAVADLLGHTSIAITGDVCGHTSNTATRAAIDGLGARLDCIGPAKPDFWVRFCVVGQGMAPFVWVVLRPRIVL